MSATAIPGLLLAGEPRAQLLPPSVKQREKTRAARRMMVMLVAASVIIAGGGIAWAYLGQVRAQQALAASQSSTQQILAQQAQYADASRLAELVAKTEEAQRLVTSTEIQWLPLAAEIATYVPADTEWTGLAFTGPAPWEPELQPEGPLREPRVAIATLEFSGSSYAPAAAFVAAIPTIHGFADVKIEQTQFKDGVYVTTVKLTLDADSVSGRFTADAAEDDDEEADE